MKMYLYKTKINYCKNNPALDELLEAGSEFVDEFLKLIGLIK
jgi:hypothetical protein